MPTNANDHVTEETNLSTPHNVSDTAQTLLPEVWCVQELLRSELDPYDVHFGNILYICSSKEDGMMKALDIYVQPEQYDMNTEDHQKQIKKHVVMKLITQKYLEGPKEIFFFDEQSMYEMITYCRQIGDAATHLRKKLLAKVHNWYLSNTDESRVYIGIFMQKIAKHHLADLHHIEEKI
jgi:hypothetical protein